MSEESWSWADLGSQVAEFAPVLGDALPVPGAGTAGEMVAQAFGTEKKPGAIAQAIKQDPDAAAKLKKIEKEHEADLRRIQMKRDVAQIEAETKRAGQVNKTMRAEYKSDVLWRRAVGWAFALALLATASGTLAAALWLVQAGAYEHISAAAEIPGAMAPIFGTFAAVLGIASHHTGKRERSEAGEDTSRSGIAGLIGAIKGNK